MARLAIGVNPFLSENAKSRQKTAHLLQVTCADRAFPYQITGLRNIIFPISMGLFSIHNLGLEEDFSRIGHAVSSMSSQQCYYRRLGKWDTYFFGCGGQGYDS